MAPRTKLYVVLDPTPVDMAASVGKLDPLGLPAAVLAPMRQRVVLPHPQMDGVHASIVAFPGRMLRTVLTCQATASFWHGKSSQKLDG
jgi:hypothetical protein